MLIFDALKEKKLEMMIETKGIKPQNLKFTFRIIIEGIEYGFPCTLIGDKVTVTIPPLSEVVYGDIHVGNYDSKLEVTGEDKYYLNPFSEKIKIKLEPEVEITMEKSIEDVEERVIENMDLKMSSIVDEDIIPDKKIEEKCAEKIKQVEKKKKSKFASSLK
jgi:hypothetical protein